MNKYKNGIIYSGNLMKYKEGVFKKNIYFIYEEETDTFCSLDDTLNYYYDLLNINLTDEEREDYQRKIKEYCYPYIPSGIPGEKYVDESSLVQISNSIEKDRR